MRENYKILNVSEDASIEEIEASYKKLKEQYSKDRFLEGEAGNRAAKKLTMVENAYREIIDEIREKENDENQSIGFQEVEQLIKENKLTEAQSALDNFNDRNAEWHYFQSVIFYKKNWNNECKKQLEIAISLDSNNPKYKDAYDKLKKQMEYNQAQFTNGPSYSNGPESRNMGGDSNDCLRFCATWCCMDMLCSMCCR